MENRRVDNNIEKSFAPLQATITEGEFIKALWVKAQKTGGK